MGCKDVLVALLEVCYTNPSNGDDGFDFDGQVYAQVQ